MGGIVDPLRPNNYKDRFVEKSPFFFQAIEILQRFKIKKQIIYLFAIKI